MQNILSEAGEEYCQLLEILSLGRWRERRADFVTTVCLPIQESSHASRSISGPEISRLREESSAKGRNALPVDASRL